jgi:hypothetical protein
MHHHTVIDAAARARLEISKFLGDLDGKAQYDWRRTFTIQIDETRPAKEAVEELMKIREAYL